MRTDKFIFFAIPFIFLTKICFGQKTKILYGNNPAAGKYYSVRGIKMYTEVYGETVDDQDSLSFEMMADDFAGLLDVMHTDSAYVIGWSDGGMNALLLAMRHPGKVIKLVSTGANMTPDSSGLIPVYWKDEQKQYESEKNKPRTTAKEKNDWKIFLLDWLQ